MLSTWTSVVVQTSFLITLAISVQSVYLIGLIAAKIQGFCDGQDDSLGDIFIKVEFGFFFFVCI